MDSFDAVERVYDKVDKLLEDICQSGFDTVQEDTLSQLQDLVQLVLQYGMTYLSELLDKLYQGLALRRHRLEQKEEGAASVFALINQYLYLCRQQAAFDKAAEYYSSSNVSEE